MPDRPDAGDLPALCAAALAREPEAPALHFEGSWWTWGELARIAAAAGDVLDAAGLPPGAPVCFVPRNRPASTAALLGLIAAGRSIRMIYAFQSAVAMGAAIRRQGCGAVLMERSDWAPPLDGLAAAAGLAVILLDAAGAVAAPGHEKVRDPARHRADGPAAIDILTSGTTGPPKSFRLPFETIARHFLPARATPPGPPPLLYLPMGNISGIYSFMPALLGTDGAVLHERYTLDGWLDYVRRWRPARSGIPPAAMAELLDRDVPPADLASLEAMGSGAAPLDPALHAAFEARYGIPILTSYGATEFAGPVAVMTPALHAQWGAAKRGSLGRAIPGAALRIVDAETGAPLAAGEIGLVEVVSPRIGPEWIRTSDLAYLDADGFLWLHGRADGAIMRGGFKLLPEVIEQALQTHPAVAEVAVAGVADSRLGAVPGALIRLAPGMDPPGEQALAAHVRAQLPATHVPACWRFVDALPRTPSCKIDRAALPAFFA